MNKTKILMPVATALSSIGVLVPLVSCSCGNQKETEKVIPTEQMNIVEKTFVGFKDDTDFSKYNTVTFPDNVKIIAKGSLDNIGKTITKVVFNKNISKFENYIFGVKGNKNIQVLDFSAFKTATMYYLAFNQKSFAGLNTTGKVIFDNELSDVSLWTFRDKLTYSGLNSNWLIKETQGNLVCNKKQLTTDTGTQYFYFTLNQEIESTGSIKCEFKIKSASENVSLYVVPQVNMWANTAWISSTLLNEEGLKVNDNVVFDVTFKRYTKHSSTTPVWQETITDLKLTSQIAEPKINHNILTPGVPYVPTIPPTETKYLPSEAQAATDSYFNSKDATTIIQEDALVYLQGYVDKWQQLSTFIPWIKENVPFVYDWLMEKLGEYGLKEVRDITYCDIGTSEIIITPPTTNIKQYRISTNLIASVKANLVNTSEKTIGELSLSVKIKLSDISYQIFVSQSSNNWQAGNFGMLKTDGWSIDTYASMKVSKEGEQDVEFVNEPIKYWDSVPTDPADKAVFEAFRPLLQWDSTYLGNPKQNN